MLCSKCWLITKPPRAKRVKRKHVNLLSEIGQWTMSILTSLNTLKTLCYKTNLEHTGGCPEPMHQLQTNNKTYRATPWKRPLWLLSICWKLEAQHADYWKRVRKSAAEQMGLKRNTNTVFNTVDQGGPEDTTHSKHKPVLNFNGSISDWLNYIRAGKLWE